jgi:hypothetical protein
MLPITAPVAVPGAGNSYPGTAHFPANAKNAVDKFSFWGGLEIKRGSEELSTYWRIDSSGALEIAQWHYYFILNNAGTVRIDRHPLVQVNLAAPDFESGATWRDFQSPAKGKLNRLTNSGMRHTPLSAGGNGRPGALRLLAT